MDVVGEGSDLIQLQSEALKLRDEEGKSDRRLVELQAELREFDMADKEQGPLKKLPRECAQYLGSIAKVLEVRRRNEQATVSGEIRVQLSEQEMVILEVSQETRFGDVVDKALDYISYPPSHDRVQGVRDDKRLGIRPRSDFFLRDRHGALLSNELLVTDVFSSSTTLW